MVVLVVETLEVVPYVDVALGFGPSMVMGVLLACNALGFGVDGVGLYGEHG